MPSYIFTPDPHATDTARTQKWIGQLMALPNIAAFIASPTNKKILVSDNHNSTSISAANRATIAANLPAIAGFNQQAGSRLIWINPAHPKKPIKIFIHEIGHLNWHGIGANMAGHKMVFYRLLNDVLVAVGLTVNKHSDLNTHDISQVASPAGNDPLGYRG
jgi:hypothetical protein